MTWDDGLSQRARERLKNVGGMSEEEKETTADEAQLDELLRRFYRDELTQDELLQHLKSYQQSGKLRLLGSAREKLRASFKWGSLGFTFAEAADGTLTVAESVPTQPETPAGAGAVLELTDATFDEVVKSNPLLVVDCWATWCGPCRMLAPVIEELARDYSGRVTFGKLDVDRNRSIAARYRVQSIPTVLIFKQGRLVDQKLGAMPRSTLEAALTRHIDGKRG